MKIPLAPGQGFCATVTRTFPGIVIAISSYLATPTEVLLLLRVMAPSVLEEVLVSIRSSPDVVSYEFLGRTGPTATILVKARRPEHSAITISSCVSLVPSFPIHVRDGVLTLLIASEAPKVRTLILQVRKQFPNMVVTSMRNAFLDIPAHLFAPRENQLFHAAVSAGYWDVPRRVSPVDMAALFQVSKSSMVEALGHIERKLLYGSGDPPFLRLRAE
jgi:predicted DNA binding protein